MHIKRIMTKGFVYCWFADLEGICNITFYNTFFYHSKIVPSCRPRIRDSRRSSASPNWLSKTSNRFHSSLESLEFPVPMIHWPAPTRPVRRSTARSRADQMAISTSCRTSSPYRRAPSPHPSGTRAARWRPAAAAIRRAVWTPSWASRRTAWATGRPPRSGSTSGRPICPVRVAISAPRRR